MFTHIFGMKSKYTKEILEPLVKNAQSISDVLRGLGLKLTGGSQSHIKRLMARYKLDTSHFLGQAYQRGKTNGIKKHWKEILVFDKSGDRRQSAHMLRRALIEYGREYVCARCDQNDSWQGKPLVLHVHHKNSNWLDNRQRNLEFVCPNCHQQAGLQIQVGTWSRYICGK
jgi:transcription elongation factor Elf1